MTDSVVDTVRLRGDTSEAERFAILDEAGSGGMGIVYRARSLTNDAIVALKVMNLATGDPARFALETEVLAKLDHENIVGYHGHGTTREGKPYLAMEWLEGETLDAVVAKGVLPAVEAVRVGRAIAAALVHAHAAGVIHRDLKPSNVFVTKSGAIKLLDFGIARIVDLGRGLTSTGQVVGTPGFMAPEQARDDQEVDGRADLFALGCVLYFALAGRRPFEASSAAGYLTKLLFEAPPSLSALAPKTPPALIDLVMRLLARERADRPESAEAVLAELETVLDAPARTPAAPGDRTLASPATPPRAEAKPAGTRRWLAIGVAVASAVALGYAIRPHDDRPPPTPSAAASATTIPSASASAPPPDDRPTVLRRACREWAAALVRAQRDDGSFSGEQHRPASGWDSAQQLFALARAKHACDAPAPTVLERGAHALDHYRTDAGWTGLGPTPAAELPATAWAALAGATLVRDGIDPGGARDAIALVRAATKPSGAFAFVEPTERVDLYSSVLGTWALVDASDDPANAGPARTAARWLAGALANDRALRGAAGLEEQALVVVLEAWRRKVVDLAPAVVEGVARDLVARCALSGTGCTRPLAEDDAIPLRPDGDAGDGSLINLWHPWLTLATDALLREGTIALPPDARSAITTIAAWSERELTAAIAIVGVAPPYKLAEYLLVVSALVER